MKKELLILCVLCACGGGGSSSNSSTTVNQCTFDVDKGEVAEIVQAAEDSGAEVVESSGVSSESSSEPANNDLQSGVIRISGTIVSGCGSEINANETENNVTQAQRLKKLIFAGEVLRLEVK